MLEILYLAFNRLEFTKTSFRALAENTPWHMVSSLVVYDDSSEDGTAEYLQAAGAEIPVPSFYFRSANFRSPPITMNDYLSQTEAELFVKIDNDICVPHNWLPAMLSVMHRNSELELLGMEAGQGKRPTRSTHRYRAEPCSHIGGVGLMKTSAFHSRPAIPSFGDRQGFTHWQDRHKPERAWISPHLLVCALDRIPEEPWISLSDSYVEKGWQRTLYHWRYQEEDRMFWKWLPTEVAREDSPLPAC